MMTFAYACNIVIAIVLAVLALEFLTVLVHRLKHVTWCYRINVMAGYTFTICAIAGYATANVDSSETFKQALTAFHALVALVLLVAAIGHIDFVFRGRPRSKNSR